MRTTVVFVLICLCAASQAGEEKLKFGLITGDKVRLRAGPGTNHTALARLNVDDIVLIVSTEGRWLKVRIPGGFACYVHRDLVSQQKDGTAVVAARRVLLRPTAGKERLALETVLVKGEVVTVVKGEGEWLKVIAPEHAHLYVYDDLVKAQGPAREHRARIAAAAKSRRALLLSERSPEDTRAIAAERKRRKLNKDVIQAGEEVLSGKGDAARHERLQRRAALECDDDLTKSYARSLLALVLLRNELNDLKKDLAAARAEKKAAVEDLSKRLNAAEEKYASAAKEAQDLKTRRENPFRGVGVIAKRETGFVLLREGKVLYRLLSRRFRLDDFVGRRVGVNGRMVAKKSGAAATHLLVEKIEIIKPKKSGR